MMLVEQVDTLFDQLPYQPGDRAWVAQVDLIKEVEVTSFELSATRDLNNQRVELKYYCDGWVFDASKLYPTKDAAFEALRDNITFVELDD